MKRALPLLLSILLLAACGAVPSASTPPSAGAPASGVNALSPGLYQVSFQNLGSDTPQASAEPITPLGAQGLVGTPDASFAFTRLSVDTFTVAGVRHVQATFQVANTGSLTYQNLKFVPVVTTGNSTPFTGLTYYDGSDAGSKAGSLNAEQAQRYDKSTRTVVADAGSSPFVTGLDVSGVDTSGQNVSSVQTSGWQVASTLAPNGTAYVTFAVNLPLDAAGPSRDPFNFNLTFTGVQDGVTLTSAVQQYSQSTKAFGNYTLFPTQTYTQSGASMTRSLPAYYDVRNVNRTGASQSAVLCAGDQNVLLSKPDSNRPDRYRVQLSSRGSHTLNVYAGTSCPASGGTLLLSQTVQGVAPFVVPLAGGIGGNHSLAVKTDGSVQSWGQNSNGQLGNGTTTSSRTAVTVSGLSGIVAVAGGVYHSLALRSDGGVQSWGANYTGQLGNGTTASSLTAVTVNGLSGVVAVAGGGYHSLALRADGSVQSWGSNAQGQLGNGTTTDSSTPVAVSGLSDVVAVGGGSQHSLALKADGSVQSWGVNVVGQLGNGTTTNSSTPVTVSGLSGVVAVAGGGNHSLALKADGSVQSWGVNVVGQLGNGTTTNSSTPVTVSGLSGIVAVVGGNNHSLALRVDGSVQGWGSNSSGQLGNGTTTNSRAAVTVSGLSGVVAVAGGGSQSLAVKADGSMQGWGGNDFGQLGNGGATLSSVASPVLIIGVAQPTP